MFNLTMKKILVNIIVLSAFSLQLVMSQEKPTASVYLLTCGPGTETYSLYGHSALRLVVPEENIDLVYNWGIFDFSTPGFAWKFARGRLQYMLGVTSYERFLQEYFLEERWVVYQKLNIGERETLELIRLIEENLKPENVSYKYDFFYDNCSTRIRDLIEKAVGGNLLYPPEKPPVELMTFRNHISRYQRNFPWLEVGIDLLLGSRTDRKASFRNSMFLPIELKDGLSQCHVRQEGKMVPLLSNPTLVVDFPPPAVKTSFFGSPLFILSLLTIVLIIVSGYFRQRKENDIIDIIVFSVFSILAVLMIFFNFFADHQQTKWNLNIIWLNPFILFCLVSLIFKKNRTVWFKLVFFLAVIFLALIVILPQAINHAFVPVIVVLILRSSVRTGFKWNPFSLPF